MRRVSDIAELVKYWTIKFVNSFDEKQFPTELIQITFGKMFTPVDSAFYFLFLDCFVVFC